MLRHVLHFGNPARLSLQGDQLLIERSGKQALTRPLEDLGAIIIDHPQVSLSTPLLVRAAEMGLVIVWCGAKHHPVSLSLPLTGHQLANLRHRSQWGASKAKNKQAWAAIVKAKLLNQGTVLESLGIEGQSLFYLARQVRSGDPDNLEARGARLYWQALFGSEEAFSREREGPFPNNFLNYGYALLRAAVARSLVGAGLCVTVGIWHHNQYNPYALADDCIEPFRPWNDWVVANLKRAGAGPELDLESRNQLLKLFHMDVQWKGSISPMMVAMDKYAASLALFLSGEKEEFPQPEFPYG